MGFRDLALFNDSLLAKQAWRLLQNKNSLFYRVFKAKFFPNCLIMEAKHSRSGSHAWTSILHVRDVLKRGCRWRIGDGKSVGIWQDFWLPRQSTPQVLSPPLEFLSEARVEILIEESERKWNHGLIDGIFTEKEAKLIKSLPLSQTAPEDSIFWPHTNNRVYTSKSRYRVLKQEASTEAANTHPEVGKNLWHSIWSLQVPNKVKYLPWRATRESLPTKQNLQRRTITDCSLCDRCKLEPETALHATWSCPKL